MKRNSCKIKIKWALRISSIAVSFVVLMLFTLPPRVPAGVQLNEESFGGLSKREAIEQLNALDEAFQREMVQFHFDDHESSQLSRSQLGIELDITATWQEMLGHQNLLSRLLSSSAGAAGSETPRDIQPKFQVDTEKMSKTVGSLLSTHEKDAKNSKLVWNGDQWEIDRETPGEQLPANEQERVLNVLQEGIEKNSIPSTLGIQYDSIEPGLKSSDLDQEKEKLNSFVTTPLEISFGDQVTHLSFTNEEEQALLELDGKQVALLSKKLREWVSNYAKERNKKPGIVRITGVEELESEYDHEKFQKALYKGSFSSGWDIDEEKLVKDVQSIFDDPSQSRTISVSLQSKSPVINSDIEGLSFPDLLSIGKSNYEEGNSADRVKNIALSLGAFNSVIVPAGETFSMNRTTGWITEDKGYTKTKVIYGGAVGTGVGGGVCQTSTTLYRAVINAGLEVAERRPHTLDVSYYHKYGYGIDAAVYTVARKDFQFVNDTGNPLLINSYIAPNEEAIVEIYGTSDGRSVELENIPTGIRNYKKWNWLVKWPEKEEKRAIESKYLR